MSLYSNGSRRLSSGKRCDHFTIDGRTVCGPALLLPATAKCGSNALSDYTGAHAPRLLLALGLVAPRPGSP